MEAKSLRRVSILTVFPASVALAAALVACNSLRGDDGVRSSAKAGPDVRTGESLSIDDLYDPDKKVDFNGKPRTSFTWIDGGHWIERRAGEGQDARKGGDAKKAEWVVVEAASGSTAPYEPLNRAEASAAARAQAEAAEAGAKWKGRPTRVSLDDLSKDRSACFVTIRRDIWVVRMDGSAPVRITDTPEVDEEEAAFSPDGKHVAFVAENDLYVADATGAGTRRITNDGSELVLNGKLDWLYQEEVYGRGTFRAFWWSPDSKSIAYLRIDEAGVPLYTIVDDVPHVPKVETTPYPRPGETNPVATLWVWSAAAGSTRQVDMESYADVQPLVVDVSWSPKNELAYCVQDREQRWLDLRLQSADGRDDRQLLRETSPAWVERNDQPPVWLADGTYLWMSERTGFKHVYRYRDDKLVNAVTGGRWEARTLHGVDEAKGLVYFSGTERSAIGSDAYVVGIDGRGLKRLTEREGTHNVSFSPDWAFFTDAWSDLWTPTQVRLFKSDGTLVRTIDANEVEALARYARSRPELLTVEARDGFEMNAMLIKPVDFDPSREYPVMMFVYAGPHAQTVKNAWGGTTGMFYQLLAQRGVVVWCCDNRTASGKGIQSAWPCYERFGETELADIEDSLAWLEKQGFVDRERIGISGWSFGGFMTGYALTHSKTFALGIAGGSVTDWRSYDSIYTERFMRLPKNNEKGYDATSVVKAAKDLHGRLVLAHGQIDDNVHPQNTVRLANELAKTDADFEVFFYPQSRHGVTEPRLVKHWRNLILREIERTLLAPRP